MHIFSTVSASTLTSYITAEDDEYYSEEEEDFVYNYYSDDSDCECDDEKPLKPQKKTFLLSKPKTPSNECCICLDTIDDEDLVPLKECNHRFCFDCLQSYIHFKTSDINCLYHTVTICTKEKEHVYSLEILKTYGVPCPAQGCKHVMLIDELTPVANDKSMEQFHKFSELHKDNLIRVEQLAQVERDLQKNNEKKCPKCESKKFSPRKRGRLQCEHCRCIFCKECGYKHSTTMTCKQFQRSQASIELYMKELGLTRCPCCFAVTQKMSGCQYMTCRCTQPFCNLCGAALDQSKHYSHFINNDPFGNHCKGRSDSAKIVGKRN